MAKKSALSIPDDVLTMFSNADTKYGFPQGTMLSVFQQETGGNARYLDKPDTYHYDLNEKGQRVAPHSGKVSTAFGPFGILESTAASPGFGVAPLKDKSFGEQLRFASEYLAARSKGGGLQSGLAGYGEGGKYAQQVLARLPKDAPTGATPVGVAQAVPQEVPEFRQLASADPVPPPAEAPVQVAQATTPQDVAEWRKFQQATSDPMASALQFTNQPPPNIDYQQYMSAPKVNFAAFGGLGKRGRA